MSVKVRLHPYLNEGKEGLVEVEGGTVGECLENLIKSNPSLREKLFEKDGKLKNFIEVLVNTKTTYPQELAYPVRDGDEIDVIVFLSGG